jgi:hypothetical protein
MASSDAPRSLVYKLQCGGRDIWLPNGRFAVGRSVRCDIVVNDTRASRRHAQFVVSGRRLTVEDLGSANGTFVNGERIGSGAKGLSVGDIVVVANLEMAVGEGNAPDRVRTKEVAPDATPPPGVYENLAPERNAVHDFPTAATERVETFVLMGAVADRAFAVGHAHDAARILKPHLDRALADLRSKEPVSSTQYDWSISYAIRLALATKQGRWFDYVVEMLDARGILPSSDEHVELLERALEDVDAVNLRSLNAYVSGLRANALDFDSQSRKRIERLQDLVGRAARKAP